MDYIRKQNKTDKGVRTYNGIDTVMSNMKMNLASKLFTAFSATVS